MDGALYRPRGHPEPRGQRGVGDGPRAGRQDDLELFELRGLSCPFLLPPEPLQHAVEQGQGPGALEEPFGGQIVRGFSEIATLGVASVDGEDGATAAALLRPVPITLIREELGARGPQVGTKPPPARVDRRQAAFLQEVDEERLGQVLRLMGLMPLVTDEGVDGKPI